MTSRNPECLGEIGECIRRDIRPTLPPEVEQLTAEQVVALRGKLQALRYYCAAKGAAAAIIEQLEAALSVAQGLGELLEQNATTFTYLRQMENIRRLDLGANLLGQAEPMVAGETELQEFALGAVATSLGWLSDTIWVDLARFDQQVVAKAHVLRLQDELWDFLTALASPGRSVALPETLALQEKMGLLFKALNDEAIPSAGRVLLLAGLYELLLVLHLNRVVAMAGGSGKA
jgi:hypothetical protein